MICKDILYYGYNIYYTILYYGLLEGPDHPLALAGEEAAEWRVRVAALREGGHRHEVQVVHGDLGWHYLSNATCLILGIIHHF